jgi:hypothetical protein
MLPVTAPAIFPGVVKAWVKQQAPALRGWVTSALIGTGLTRHVPSTENKLEPHQVFDSFLASTKGLTSELIAALRRYVIYIHVHVYHYHMWTYSAVHLLRSVSTHARVCACVCVCVCVCDYASTHMHRDTDTDLHMCGAPVAETGGTVAGTLSCRMSYSLATRCGVH